MKTLITYLNFCQRLLTSRSIRAHVAVFIFALALQLVTVLHASGQQLYGGFNSGGPSQMGSIGHYDLADGMMKLDHTFDTQFDGAYPYGGMIEVDGKLYGMTQSGGKNNQGILFEWDIVTGTYSKKVEFGAIGLFHPYSTLTYVNGKVYGTTSTSIFEWDIATNVVTPKVALTHDRGIYPYGSMVYVNGKFYGMASQGGSYFPSVGYPGVIFEWDPVTNIYTKKHQFDGANGAFPYGTLCYYNGAFYGVTQGGGAANFGVLFKWDPATNTFSKKMDFTGPNGRNPYGGLVEFNGKLYGTTYFGGSNYSETNVGAGVLYEWDPVNDVFTKKHDLASKGIYNSLAPLSKLGGKLYGTGYWNIFEFDPITNTLLARRSIDGGGPRSDMTAVNGTDFYGVTPQGGASGRGIIYKWTPSTNAYARLMDFSYAPQGFQPHARLTDIGNGKLYGITTQGGPTFSSPAIFEYDLTTKQYTRKRDVSYPGPAASLIHHRGKFYLTTYSAIYEWDHMTNQFLHRVSFFGANGNSAMGNVVYHEGKFYGTTYYGGGTQEAPTNLGVIFEWDPDTNVYTRKHDFDGINGANPYGQLAFYDGKFYGTTIAGGANQFGVIFEWDPSTNAFKKLVDFDSKAQYSYGGLTLLNDKLYGTNYVGDNSLGSLFEFDPKTNLISKRLVLTDYRNGGHPYGVDFTVLGGKLYGIMNGGLNGYGVVFEWDPTNNIYTKKADLTASHNGAANFPGLVSGGTKKQQHISFAGPLNKTYGNERFLLEASSTSGLPVLFTSSNKNVATIEGNEVTILNAGSTVIRAYQDGDDATYPAQAIDVTLTVAKANLRVTAEDKEREYGVANPALTISYSGFVNGDDATKISKPNAFTSASQSSAVGVYAVNVSGGSATNYTFQYVAGKLTITKAPLTARADNKTKEYGNTNPALTITYSGFRNGDTPSRIVPPGISTTALQLSDVGSYPITLANGSAQNYELTLENGSLTITKASLSAVPDNKTRKYLEDNPPFTVSYSGFKGADNIGVLDELPVVSTAAVRESDAGLYPIDILGGKDNNYAFALKKGVLTIEQAGQEIKFEELPEKTIFDPPFSISATASSGLAVIFHSSDPAIASIEGNTITLNGEGTAIITASQPGSKNYKAAAKISRSLVVTGKEEQQITFAAFSNDLFAGQTVSLGATTTSGLEVSYVIADPSIAVIEGSTLRLLKGGVTTITASQGGDDQFYPAEDVHRTLDVHSIEIIDLMSIYCAASPFTISYDVAGTFDASNVFTLELSSPSGDFNNAQVLDVVNGTSSGYFTGDIPTDAFQSESYRLRIRSSAPAGTIVGGQNVTIDTAPVISSVEGPMNPTPITSSVSVIVKYTDRELSDASIDWGDGSITSGSISTSMISASHTYATPGVFTITARIVDNCGKEAESIYQYVVIYDPYGSFVTGGGWFQSPAGGYLLDQNASGKANFGFVSKYQKGASAPTGNSDFQFHAGNLSFKSTSYEWLVIAGHKAMFKGAGNLNGSPGYGFLISAVDGNKTSSTSADKFRIKIWDAGGSVVYDNQMGAADDAEATTVIGGGSIVIHESSKSTGASGRTSETNDDPLTQVEENPLRAYPNPFVNSVMVEFYSDVQEDLAIHLMDITGRTIYNRVHNYRKDGLYELRFSEAPLPPQMYLLKINQGRRMAFIKLVRN